MRYMSLWPTKSVASPRDFMRRFDDIFESFSDELATPEWKSFTPALDVEERAKDYLLKFDIPGMEEKDIKVEVRDNVLFVSGEREEERKSNGDFSRYERFHGKFERAMTLPRYADADKIEAKYKNGVLELTVPKTEASVSKLIEVKYK